MRVDAVNQRLLFDVDECYIINTEKKQLPFKFATKLEQRFLGTADLTAWAHFEMLLGFIVDPATAGKHEAKFKKMKLIVIDSFTRLLTYLSEHLKANGIRGFEFWKEYGERIEKILLQIQDSGKFVVFDAIEDLVQDYEGIAMKCAKIQGNIMRGNVESFFTIALFTYVNRAKKGAARYQFYTNSDGTNLAKTPMQMFDIDTELLVQNDLANVLYRIYKYYEMDKHPEAIPPAIIIVGKSGSGKSSSLSYCFEDATKQSQ